MRCNAIASLIVATWAFTFVACGGGSKASSNLTTTNSGGTGTTTSNTGGSGASGTGGSGTSSGSGPGTGAVAYAYTSNGSSIFGYAVNSDGTLTAVPGSPFAVSTQITATPGSLVTNGANVFAIAAGGTNLSIMPLNKSNGSLSQTNLVSALTGDPNSGDTVSTLSLDATGQSLYVELGLSDLDSGLNVFSVGSSNTAQQIQFLPSSAIAQSALVFTANNETAYAFACSARVNGVFAYHRNSDGTLTPLSISIPQPNPPVSIAGTGFCPIGMAASATGRVAIAWVPFQFNSSVTVGNQTYVGIYNVNSDSSLTLVPNSGVTPASTSTLSLNFDPTGSNLAVAGNGGVQTYMLNSGGTLTPVASPQDAGVSFIAVAWDKSNHVFATTSTQLYVWNANNGMLSGASGSPYPGGTALAVLPLQ